VRQQVRHHRQLGDVEIVTVDELAEGLGQRLDIDEFEVDAR
jgi:hypothetical protein